MDPSFYLSKKPGVREVCEQSQDQHPRSLKKLQQKITSGFNIDDLTDSGSHYSEILQGYRLRWQPSNLDPEINGFEHYVFQRGTRIPFLQQKMDSLNMADQAPTLITLFMCVESLKRQIYVSFTWGATFVVKPLLVIFHALPRWLIDIFPTVRTEELI